MPASTFEDILKFNPYHDAKGRFSAADSAVLFTYKPGKSTAHDNAITRAKEAASETTDKGFKGTLYHGSPATDIEEFDMSRAGQNTSSGEKLLFFTDSKQMAEDFSYERLEGSTKYMQRRGKKGRVYEVDVEMKNPLDLRNLSEKDIDNILKLDVEGILTREVVQELLVNHQLLKTSLDLRADSLKKLGYDGFIANTGKAGHNSIEYAVVDSKQAKIKKSIEQELDTDEEIDLVVRTWTDTDGIYADGVEKGNPWHDPKNGRFTTGPKGGNPMIRTAPPPKNTKIAYKVFVVKDGKLYPPMVANPDGQDTPVGVWLDASEGKMATDKDGNPITNTLGRNKVKAGGKGTQGGSGTLAYRPGWHLGELPIAEQFYTKDKTTGEKKQKKNFVWAECEIAADVDYQEQAMSYGYNKNGKFQHSLAGLPAIPKDGFYTYRTNPDPNTKPWYITGAMKVNRILTDAETNSILRAHGIEPMKRDGGELDLAALGITETNFVGKSLASNVAKTFDDILKFNPYHDNLGRFTTADSATLFTYRTKDPAKQGLADNAREREKARTTAAEAPQPKKIREIEDQIRNQDIETAAVVDKDGNTVFMKDGEEDRVRFTNEEGDLMRGNVLTHNHPSSSMLSPADVSCFVGNELEEIRATNREGITYSLKRNQNYTKFGGTILASDYDFEAYMAEVNAQRELDSKGYADKIISGQMSQQAANKEFTGIMTNQLTDWFRRHAPEYGVEFTIEKRNIQKSAGGTTFRKSASGGEIVLDKDFEASIKAAFNEWLRRNGIEPEEEPVKKEFSIYKTDEDKRLVFGWASISLTVDGEQIEDRQQDIIDPEDLEEAAYEYVLNFRDTGEEHIPTMRKKGKLVESCVLTAEKQKAMGIPEGTVPVGWWIGFKITDDDAWNRVKSGHYKMFSIEGQANRLPVEKADSVAKSFEEILKYNDNHDELGRFAPKSSGGIVRSGKTSKAQQKRDEGKKLTEKEFNKLYYAHKLNLRGDDNLAEQVENIQRDGFRTTGHFNVMPADINNGINGYSLEDLKSRGYTQEEINHLKETPRGGVWRDETYYPNVNLAQMKYGARKGDTVMLVTEADVEGKSKVKNGFKPFDFEIVTVERDFQPYYELYEKAYDKSHSTSKSFDDVLKSHEIRI